MHSDTQAHIEEVGIGRAPLPHSRPADDGVQLLRVTVHEQLASALLLRCALDLVAVLVELPQVDSALLLLLAPADAAAAAEVGH